MLVLPYRNPVLTAKMAASLDVLSGGRLILGIGAGWLREEFEALNSPAFEARGAVTDEWITIFKQLWSEAPATFEGRFYRYADIRCEPFPVQKPHPPIWVGGHEPAALRRAAKYGDGWHAYRLNADELAEKAGYIRKKAQELGRDPAAIELSVRAPLILADKSVDIDRAFSGTDDDVKSQLKSYADIGCEYFVFEPPLMEGIDRSLEVCERFAKKIAPEFA